MENKNRCSRCGKDLPRSELIPYNRKILKKTGFVREYYYCRPCNTNNARRYRETEDGAKAVREAVYRSVKKHKEKSAARQKVGYAVKTGKILKPEACTHCKKEGLPQAHHADYAKPLDVSWLCTTCHADTHRLMV